MRVRDLWTKAVSLSINAKLNLLILGLLGVPFVVFGLLWYRQSTDTIERNSVIYNQELVRQINGQLSSYFADLERSTFPLVSNPLLQTFMQLEPDDYVEQIQIKASIESELLPNLFFGRTDIYGFSIISTNGVSSNYGNIIARNRDRNKLEELTGHETYKVLGLNYDQSNPVITVIRKFWDTQKYRTVGYLIFDLNLNRITDILNSVRLGQTGFVALIDQNGIIVHHADSRLWGRDISAEERQQFESSREGFFVKKSEAGDILVIFIRSALNDWTIVSEVPVRELVSELIRVRNVTTWGGGGLLLLVLVLLGVFSFYLTRSLKRLQRLMKLAEAGDLSVQAPDRREDEIGQLNRSFNRMVAEIRRLIEVVHTSEIKEKELQIRQRDAVMLAMQSQINPHFLYNTLEVINAYALVEGVTPISNMAAALADLFRYSLGNPKEIVPLREEIDHLRSYFEIQKERHRSLEIEIGLKDLDKHRVQAVRLIVQPLVENAFKHGYERHKKKPSYIGVLGEARTEGYAVRVVDCGGGMPSEWMESYNKAFQSPEWEAREAGQERIGLQNVHQRVRLVFGYPSGLSIVSSDESGTVVELLLPYQNNLPIDSNAAVKRTAPLLGNDLND